MQPTSQEMSPRSVFRRDSLSQIPQHSTNVKKGLVKVKRVSKEKMWDKDNIQERRGSLNHVFEVGGISYVKVGKEGEEGAATMEKLMWRFALFFEVDEFFTPTDSINLSPRRGQNFITTFLDKETFISRRKGSLSELTESRKILASIQTKQEGKTLQEILKPEEFFFSFQDHNVTEETFCKSLFISLAFGMFDVGPKNIIISEEREIKFFDNTRSLPHSNGLYAMGEFLHPSFRAGLLLATECYEPISKEMREIYLQMVVSFQEKMDGFENFLEEEEIQSDINSLPPGWFHKKTILSSMRERLQKLKLCLLNAQEPYHIDLVCFSSPFYRFFAVLTLIKEILSEKALLNESDCDYYWAKSLALAGTVEVNEALFYAFKKGFDLFKLMTVCQNPNLDHISLVMDIQSQLNQKEATLYRFEFDAVKRKLYSLALIDLKDVNRKFTCVFIDLYLRRLFNLFEFHGISCSTPPEKGSPCNYTLKIGNTTYPVDVYSKPGCFIIENNSPMRLNELQRWMKEKEAEYKNKKKGGSLREFISKSKNMLRKSSG